MCKEEEKDWSLFYSNKEMIKREVFWEEEEKKRHTMMESGEPYMMMEKTEAAKPQKSFLILPSNAKTDTNATAVKAPIANPNKPPIFPFSFFGAYIMNTITYINSITAPVPFIVDTNILCGDTNGNPYLFYIFQQK